MVAFYTIDELLRSFSYHFERDIQRKNLSICEYIVQEEISLVDQVLISETNKPSSHDLLIINSINKILSNYEQYEFKDEWEEIAHRILNFYCSRKVN